MTIEETLNALRAKWEGVPRDPAPVPVPVNPVQTRKRKKSNPNGAIINKGFSSRVGRALVPLDPTWAISLQGLIIDGRPSLALRLLKRGGQRAVVVTNPTPEGGLFNPVTAILAHYPGDISPHNFTRFIEGLPLFG